MDRETLRADMLDGLEYSLDQPLGADIVDALKKVPRHEFTNPEAANNADSSDSRILQPELVARLLIALDAQSGDETLIVGSGVGYTAAALAEIVGGRHVHAIDLDRQLVSLARQNLQSTGYDHVLVDRRDGANGYPEYAPFDRILVESSVIEPPRALVDQLAPGGRLVIPQGTTSQTLVAFERDPKSRTVETAAEFGPVRFRPMLVDGEQASTPVRNRTEREDSEFDEQGYFAPSGWEYEWLDWDERL
ncbi:protein-L-isoaspartate(D-aspartate) O-methyltransferase [Halohasta litchfieldiae]|jgi:protein-L-isoaspartate(D-aspartate) O-methyltransferase|uniref:protein-L-isoaspartate(D-aspartate) O-methyltransferase n=1 Tax=Halohasta litchfieldiae TaxID=1073996 RepID=A0A1H6UK13_9EURY|nr:protein-L-isoaspartate O-methyltransferase [Halohasta litchfieldiae]ATW87417.1 protein-L-isoaspartate(D-aspartate) O-methyltransferase [Halohasta litchfieldiae]SEI90057.1 protein-L-isoaspartate(D-aspartate) O-methyltransferase [Halohasta litchfieldiae]